MSTNDPTRVRLSCSEGCGGHYAATREGGECSTCGNPVSWLDITPHLDAGEALVDIKDPASPTGAWLAVRLAPDTRDE